MRTLPHHSLSAALAVLLLTGVLADPQPATSAVPPQAPAVAAPLPPQGQAMAEAQRTGRPVELVAERSETGQVFANPSGTKTLVQHATPVRVRRGSGWVAPDPTLRRDPDGAVRPVATVSPIVLSGGGSSTLLSIGKAGRQVRMGWPGSVPAPRLSGAVATYPEVFPGVDLRITVGVDDFSHVLVVKNRTAARNPALRTLRYPISADGLSLTVRKDGTLVAADRSGTPVYTAGSPLMWNSARQARVGLLLAAGDLVLTPDLAMLTDPAARFPILIDPSLTGNQYRWTHVNRLHPEQSYWNYDRAEGAKVGYAWDCSGNMYRSFFQVRTTNGAQTIAGSRIISASFRITLNHSPTGTPTPVQLWRSAEIDPAVPLKWSNSGGHWLQHLADDSVEAYPPPENKATEFAGAALKTMVQTAADQRLGQLAFGLKAPDERNLCGSQTGPPRNQWKKFLPATAAIAIEYNNTPRVPRNLNLTRPKPCGTSSAPIRIGYDQPQFAAVANDPDTGDNVTTTLRIQTAAGATVHTADVGPTVSGAAFSWPAVPAGVLTPGIVYRYHAFTSDSYDTGPVTPDCYFVVDTELPAAPVISSTDYPNGGRVIAARTAGTVRFDPGGTDTDLAEYVYGFSQDRVTMRVRTGPDGKAAIPVTLWSTGGSATGRLYVRAVDQAGNTGPVSSWLLGANAPTGEVPHVRGDSNGDGKADITPVLDHGFGRTAVWNVTSTTTAFHSGVMAWDTGQGGGYELHRTRFVQGDLDGDGRSDLALFRQGGGRRLSLYQLISDSNRYTAPPATWDSGPDGPSLTSSRFAAGDVTGDGRADVMMQTATAEGGWDAQIFTADTGFATPVSWVRATDPWSGSTPLLADVDGDGDADLVSMRNLTGCRTVIDLYRSTGSGFQPATQVYDSGAGNYCWERSKAVVADADGDGRDDLVTLYEHAASDAGLRVFRFDGTAMQTAEWWRRAGALDLSKATLQAGDFDADGKADAAVLYACCATGEKQVLTYRSTGTAFGEPAVRWQGQVDAVAGPSFSLEHRQYELVNRNSGKCLNVLAANPNDGATFVQYACKPVNLNARFRLQSVGGTDQYSLRPVHTATGPISAGGIKCAEVQNSSQDDGVQVIQRRCGSGNGEPTANQQATIEYVDGAGYDTVVQLRFAHSGKCATVKDAGTADNVAVVQQSCGQLANQQWVLRATYNATQLGSSRYRIEAAIGTNVLDVKDCQTTDGIPLRMWVWVAGSPCQKWQLESLGDDLYKIIDPNSGKALDIRGCSVVPRATIQLWPSNDGECQRWRIEPAPGGTYSVIAAANGLSLDVAGCSPDRDAEVITWFYHGQPCQRWLFKPVT